VDDPQIVFDAVWKKFRRGERHDSIRDLVPAVARRMLGRARPSGLESDQEFWALRDVSFTVGRGEALGIIGANGAGKSTILKLLSRILKPTRGVSIVRGHVGALIEVAAGFHPDLSGRENVFLQGAVMGMKQHDIVRRLDEIVDFAGVREFLDTPIKRYSSGMNARLGFSIAAHLDADTLLIDEVLAVGDLAFQNRCYEKMQAFKRRGVAIVFVSHNLSAVAALCDRVLLLNRGRVATIGEPQAAFASYAADAVSSPASDFDPGSGTLTITNRDGSIVSNVEAGEEIIVRGSLHMSAASSPISSGIRVKRVDTGELVFLTTGPSVGCAAVPIAGPTTLEVEWRLQMNVTRGHYTIEVVAYEAVHREILTSAGSPLLLVSESHSEKGVAHLSARCSVQPIPIAAPGAGRASPG
jgi:lipopolysaccharide transport system ATP-binding protein